MKIEGAWTALVTPFRGGEVDEKALRDLVERQIVAGIDGLIPCGTTGESVTLNHAEYTKVVRVVVEQAKKRVPVFAGAGTVSTRHTIELAETARDAGVDGLLLVTPYYNRPTQAGLIAHFTTVLRSISLPSILYNVPSRTGVDMLTDTVEKLCELREVVGLKEASGNVLRSQDVVARVGDRLSVLSGDDALTVAILAVGGTGVISVTSNIAPAEVAGVVRRFREGDLKAARQAHTRLLGVHDAMFVESNPGPVKVALAQAGRIAPEVRLPLVWPTDASAAKVRLAVSAAGLAP